MINGWLDPFITSGVPLLQEGVILMVVGMLATGVIAKGVVVFLHVAREMSSLLMLHPSQPKGGQSPCED
jgi:hypothetical protein